MAQHLHRFASGTRRAALIAGAILLATTVVAASGTQNPPAGTVDTVPVASLKPLLPSPSGWTTEKTGAEQVEMSDTCAYPVATATYANSGMRVRLKLVDSGRNPDSLMAIATMVMTLPPDYLDQMSPTTVIKRSVYKGAQAAERWDGDKGEGEFTLVVDGRFIVQAEGLKVDSMDTVRAIVDLVDLKKLAELK